MLKLRNNGIMGNIIIFITLLLSLWGILWSLIYWGIGDLAYFTNQSNILVFITLFIVFIGKDNHKLFPYLSAIALINIVMTGLIYHIMLATPPISFQSHLTHTITPILYVLFYFFTVEETIKTKKFWILFIYPLLYFLYFLITGPFTAFYPYGFMDVSINGLLSVLQFVLVFLLPGIVILSITLIYIKNRLEDIIKG